MLEIINPVNDVNPEAYLCKFMRTGPNRLRVYTCARHMVFSIPGPRCVQIEYTGCSGLDPIVGEFGSDSRPLNPNHCARCATARRITSYYHSKVEGCPPRGREKREHMFNKFVWRFLGPSVGSQPC